MKKLNLSSEETVYVGDMALDAETGRKAEVKTIIVLTGSSNREEVIAENPFKIINQISEILSFID